MTGDFAAGPAQLGIVGAGVMGQGIAQVALESGLDVVLVDVSPDATRDGAERVLARLDRRVEKGRLDGDEATALRSRLQVASDLTRLARSGAVIEAIVEDLDAKRELFRAFEAVVADHCPLATNTSALSIGAIARACRRPERVGGLHFFNPVPAMPLVEVVRGFETNDAALATLHALARRLGKTPIEVRDSPGFLVNLGGRAFTTEALQIEHEGVASPAQVDAILRDGGGFRMGPFELMDLTGMDVNVPATLQIHRAFAGDPRLRTTPRHMALLDAGRLGRKTGIGHYRYDPGGRPLDRQDPDLRADVPPARAVFAPAPEPQTGEPALARLLATSGIERLAEDDGAAPLVVTLEGEDLSTFAARTGLDTRRLVAIDTSGSLDVRVTLMTAPGADTAVRDRLGAAFRSSGRKVTAIRDSPGFVLQRMLAMIANLGAEMAQIGLATPADIDLAMRLGLGYPRGPFDTANALGVAETHRILERLQAVTGDDRYRPSLWLRRRALLGLPLDVPG